MWVGQSIGKRSPIRLLLGVSDEHVNGSSNTFGMASTTGGSAPDLSKRDLETGDGALRFTDF
eukprot:scaffold10345_cov158-Cylindrotheca_fusiformis.AAC.3